MFAKLATRQTTVRSQSAANNLGQVLPQRKLASPGPSWDLSGVPVFAPGSMQRKLAVGHTDDPLEHEADHVAEQVMRTSGTIAPPRAGGNAPAAGDATGIVERTLLEPGQPLPASTRAFFEPRFGRSFADVRVHTGKHAAGSARDVNARAYTVGSNIVFADREYQPDVSDGKTLLAHELTHVVQQTSAPGRMAPRIQRDPPKAAPQVTQALYDQAVAALKSKPGVNPIVIKVLSQGKVNQRVKGVHSASSTMQVPVATGADAGAASTPALQITFDLEISNNAAQVPPGAFADFVNDPANQLTDQGKPATGEVLTRLLKIVTKAPQSGAIADLLGEALVHEGTHMALAIDEMLSLGSGIQGLSAGMTGAQTSFDKYKQAATASSLKGGLVTSLVAEVNRVLPPAAPPAPAVDVKKGVENVLDHLLEERFAIDQQSAAFGRAVSNMSVASAYIWDLLGAEFSQQPWPQPLGPGVKTLLTAVAAFLDDVKAKLNPPPAPAAPSPKPAGSGQPAKKP